MEPKQGKAPELKPVYLPPASSGWKTRIPQWINIANC